MRGAELAAPADRGEVVHQRGRRALGGDLLQPRVHPARCSAVKPRSRLAAPTYQWRRKTALVVAKAGVGLLDPRAELRERRRRLGDQAGDLGLDRGVAERPG